MRFDIFQNIAGTALDFRAHLRIKAKTRLVGTSFDDFIEPVKRTAANEENLRRINLNKILVRVLTSTIGRDVGYRTFKNFQKRLLNAFAGHITRNRDIFTLPGDLIDLVDVNNAALCKFHIKIRRLNETQQDVFYVVADIPRFRERRRIRDGKRNLQNPRKRLCQKGLAAAGRTKQQDVGFLYFNAVVIS